MSIDSEDVITMTCIVALATVLLSIVGSVYYSARGNREMFERLVKGGQDPVRVVCAREIQGDSPASACFALLAGKVPNGK
jgi:hypothetical protein